MTSNIPTSNSTASLVSNTHTVSSTLPLNPRQTPQKDYAAAFGALQSRYGVVSSHLPPPTTVVKQKKAQDAPQISTGRTSGIRGGIDSEVWVGDGGYTPASDSPSTTTVKGSMKKRSFLPWRGQSTLGISGTSDESSGSGGAHSSTPSSTPEGGKKESEGAKTKRSMLPWNFGGK